MQATASTQRNHLFSPIASSALSLSHPFVKPSTLRIRNLATATVCMSLREDGPSVTVVGVTGAVGQEFLRVLSDLDFPYRSIRLLASRRSAGKQLTFEDRRYAVEELRPESFDGIDIVLFSAVPLVIPEVNPEAMAHIKIKGRSGKGALIANPNCSTIICLMAATPLHRHAKVIRVSAMMGFGFCKPNCIARLLKVEDSRSQHPKLDAGFIVLLRIKKLMDMDPTSIMRHVDCHITIIGVCLLSPPSSSMRSSSASSSRSFSCPFMISLDDFRSLYEGSSDRGSRWLLIYKKRPPRDFVLCGFNNRFSRRFKIPVESTTVAPGEDLYFLAASSGVFLFCLQKLLVVQHYVVEEIGLKLVVDPSGVNHFHFLFVLRGDGAPAACGGSGVAVGRICTYQASRGAGAAAIEELVQQTHEVLDGKEPTCKIFKQQYAFNLFSHTAVLSNGYNEEEMKLVKETQKIWNDKDVKVTATCIRVPVMHAHAESVNLQFEKPLDETPGGASVLMLLITVGIVCFVLNDSTCRDRFYLFLEKRLVKNAALLLSKSHDTTRYILEGAAGLVVVDNRDSNHFPTPLDVSFSLSAAITNIGAHMTGSFDRWQSWVICSVTLSFTAINLIYNMYHVLIQNHNRLELFVCGEQICKGAALNAIQIAEKLL
ncbi:hypothetical protein ZIOFF_063551 [Zingiber officinale]|uniref:Semialdehyde dehydrogenase NAD-binding domain-containing protein n=1 Tax=Zingiber officinale TaxID=94328 RepID=A0A8J5KK80_ZINOF|nr:hypothetical protein ZIOFF_063551 [Zingiber officinale]